MSVFQETCLQGLARLSLVKSILTWPFTICSIYSHSRFPKFPEPVKTSENWQKRENKLPYCWWPAHNYDIISFLESLGRIHFQWHNNLQQRFDEGVRKYAPTYQIKQQATHEVTDKRTPSMTLSPSCRYFSPEFAKLWVHWPHLTLWTCTFVLRCPYVQILTVYLATCQSRLWMTHDYIPNSVGDWKAWPNLLSVQIYKKN